MRSLSTLGDTSSSKHKLAVASATRRQLWAVTLDDVFPIGESVAQLMCQRFASVLPRREPRIHAVAWCRKYCSRHGSSWVCLATADQQRWSRGLELHQLQQLNGFTGAVGRRVILLEHKRVTCDRLDYTKHIPWEQHIDVGLILASTITRPGSTKKLTMIMTVTLILVYMASDTNLMTYWKLNECVNGLQRCSCVWSQKNKRSYSVNRMLIVMEKALRETQTLRALWL